MTEIGDILNKDTMELLEKLGLEDYDKLMELPDEEILQIKGIGQATLAKLRNLEPPMPEVAKEDAEVCISLRYLTFPGEISVSPGDEIPSEFADEQVAKGKARWR